MKKFALIFLFLLGFSLMGYSQAGVTNVANKRVATRSVAFGTNLPAGTTIVCLSDTTYWTVKDQGVAKTFTITTALAAGTIKIINTDLSTTRTDSTMIILSNAGEGSAGTTAVLDSVDATHAGVMTADMYNKLAGVVSSSGIMYSEPDIEVAADDAAGYQVPLTFIPIDSTGITMEIGGHSVPLTTGFYCGTLSNKTLTVIGPVYKWDVVKVIYTKKHVQ